MTVPATPPFWFTTRSRTDILRNPQNYNTNNHRFHTLPAALQAIEKVPKPSDSPAYINSLRSTSYSRFRPLLASFQQPPSPCTLPDNLSGTIPLSGVKLRLLHDAVNVGIQLGRLSELHREDIGDLFLPLLNPYFPAGEARRCFIRLDECSPKDGEHRMGPLSSPRQVIEGLITSTRVFKTLRRAMQEGSSECIHILTWRDDISDDK